MNRSYFPAVPALILMTALGGLHAAVPDAGSVGFWNFDAASEGIVRDRSNLGNDAKVVDGTFREEGGVRFLSLDGIDGQVDIPLRSPIQLKEGVTISLWVRFHETRTAHLFGVRAPKEEWITPVFGLAVVSGHLLFAQPGAGSPAPLLAGRSVIPTGKWTHIVAVSDPKGQRLYLDGRQDAESAGPITLAPIAKTLQFGSGKTGSIANLRADLVETRLYDRPLTSGEVADLFVQGRASYPSSSCPLRPADRDSRVTVETHESSPADAKPWMSQPTRLIGGIEGFRTLAAGEIPKLSRFGGWMDGPREKETGFFRTQRIGDRWWLVDPDGWLFFSIGVNAVAGIKEDPGWVNNVTSTLREWGFNTLGMWSSRSLVSAEKPLPRIEGRDFFLRFAYDKHLIQRSGGVNGADGYADRCAPFFHPDFEAFCDEYAKSLSGTATDPFVLGIMSDNEIDCPVDLLDRCLAGDPGKPEKAAARDAAEKWLFDRKGTHNTDKRSITRRDRYEFIAFAFGWYYRIVSGAIRKYDPNHLYLGSRICFAAGQFDNPWWWRAVAPYHDVVSVNYYHRWGPQESEIADWAEWGGKPLIFTEWYAKALDAPGLANVGGAGWIVRTQQERGEYFQHFALAALESSNVVGFHYFKYRDDPSTAKGHDRAGGCNKGLFDSTEKPYDPLLKMALAVNREAYRLIQFFDARREAARAAGK